MGFLAPIGAAISAVGAVAGLFQKPKKEQQAQPAALPMAPSVASAQNDAKAQLEKKRRISLLQGGNTDVTRSGAVLQPGNISQKQLVGQ